MPGRHHRARISSALVLFMMKRSRNEVQALLGEKKRRSVSDLKCEVCWDYQGNKHLIAPLPNFDV